MIPTNPTPVLHLITRLIIGGAQENTILTAAGIDRTRYQAKIMSGPQTGNEGSLIEEARSLGVSVTILADLVRQVSPVHDLRALTSLSDHFRRAGYPIVHTHSSKAGILGRLAARLAHTPVIIHTIHGWSFHKYMSPRMQKIYIFLERWMASFTDALIAVSDRDIQKGLDAGIGRREQYHRIRSAISLESFNPSNVDPRQVRHELNIPEDALVVGNVGRFSPQKNPLDWVRVAGRIGRAQPRVRFLLVGDGPLHEPVERLLAQEGLSGRTILTGLRRDIDRMLAAMDLFLLTSLWEGLPRTIPQAMAMGLPVVATSSDGTVEAVRNGVSGLLCEPGDLDGLANCCLKLLSDPEQRAKMGSRARSIAADEFDLKDMILQIEDLYDRLLIKKGLR